MMQRRMRGGDEGREKSRDTNVRYRLRSLEFPLVGGRLGAGLMSSVRSGAIYVGVTSHA
jgi:hypothetical protein